MNIQSTNISMGKNSGPAFSGRLFAPSGRQIKSFEAFAIGREDQMAKRGSHATDIFVKKFISKENPAGDYENLAEVAVDNPLFGIQKFVANVFNRTNSPVEGDHIWSMDLLTARNRTDNLENRALRGSLIDRIKEAADGEEKNPVKILANMLKACKPEKHGFSNERVGDFQRVAEGLTEELLAEGAKTIEK